MAQAIAPAVILKRYFETGAAPINMAEMKAFLNACTPEDKLAYAKAAAKTPGILREGEVLTDPATSTPIPLD